MASQQVTVIARTKARSGMEERSAEAAGAFVGPTRQEEGCINCDLHRSAEDPSELVLYEYWRSQEDLDRRLKSPHVERVLE